MACQCFGIYVCIYLCLDVGRATTLSNAFRTITADSDSAFIEVGDPPEFSTKVLNAMKTNPLDIDLRLLSSVYFKLAERWLSLVEDGPLLDVLLEVSQI